MIYEKRASKTTLPRNLEKVRNLNQNRFYKLTKQTYKDHLKFLSRFSDRWATMQRIYGCNILYDETVNSLKTLRSRSKRAGKYKQHTYLVCFNELLGYGYAINTYKHFQKTNPSDLKEFKEIVSKIDEAFSGSWVKDARKWGKSSRIEGMLETDNKYLTMSIERRFGWVKNKVYREFKKQIKTQDQLEEAYRYAFNKYNITIIATPEPSKEHKKIEADLEKLHKEQVKLEKKLRAIKKKIKDY